MRFKIAIPLNSCRYEHAAGDEDYLVNDEPVLIIVPPDDDEEFDDDGSWEIND